MRQWLDQLMTAYRLRSRDGRRSSLRILLYPIFGYALAGRWEPFLIGVNLLAVVGTILAARLFNDFCDGERAVSRRCWVWWLAAPLALLAPFYTVLVVARRALLGMYLGFTAGTAYLFVLYLFPPFRLKERPPWGVVVAPLLTAGLFVQAYLWLAPPYGAIGWVAVLMGLLQCQAELLQVVDHGADEKMARPQALRWLRRVPVWHGLIAAAAACTHPIFLLGTAAALHRYVAVRRLPPEGIRAVRGHWRSPVWSLYELAGYAGARWLGMGW